MIKKKYKKRAEINILKYKFILSPAIIDIIDNNTIEIVLEIVSFHI
jgi:hypothetical protein